MESRGWREITTRARATAASRGRERARTMTAMPAVVTMTRVAGADAATEMEKTNRQQKALVARMEYHARRATETARALAEARDALECAAKEAKCERERANAATAACQSLRRELGRVQRLNLDSERKARYELERGAKARKALMEMVQDAKKDAKDARGALKASNERARLIEEWAKRRDAAATHAAARLRRMMEDAQALARRLKVVTEENVRLRRRYLRDRAELDDANEYSERLETDWTTRDGAKIVVRNPIFAGTCDDNDVDARDDEL